LANGKKGKPIVEYQIISHQIALILQKYMETYGGRSSYCVDAGEFDMHFCEVKIFETPLIIESYKCLKSNKLIVQTCHIYEYICRSMIVLRKII
jgi:hypothetical protein